MDNGVDVLIRLLIMTLVSKIGILGHIKKCIEKESGAYYNAIFDSKIPPIETPSPNYLEALDLTPLRWHIPAHTEKSS